MNGDPGQRGERPLQQRGGVGEGGQRGRGVDDDAPHVPPDVHRRAPRLAAERMAQDLVAEADAQEAPLPAVEVSEQAPQAHHEGFVAVRVEFTSRDDDAVVV